MTIWQAACIAVLQGLTELFPVSSLGHAVLLPALLGWNIDEKAITFLPFLVFLHAGTAAALLLFFWQDWYVLLNGASGRGEKHYVKESRHILLLIVVATIPAVVIGALLEKFLRTLFGTPSMAAFFLVVNGTVLLLGERLRRRTTVVAVPTIAALRLRDAFMIGCWQCLAFLPGISRSGTTMIGGLLRGLDHEGAARFSFLIALPIIAAATLHQTVSLLHAHVMLQELRLNLLGAFLAFVAAFASTAFLMRYFRGHDRWALAPFAFYSITVGIVGLALLVAV
ncbi:undecaprenyl-diphosphate phosphatase [Rhizosaccharibacter radicis]|uniref:Undecaprenyl-diphosphatase n=1 Tax=Rhizosaccharibacter radicis TaxID=2782605 RepID=A0ABT1VYQ8_9PROT|nr:undecaprenyl-diphosphate phosphatase [Acetobacteraceae bacterium KSS12]